MGQGPPSVKVVGARALRVFCDFSAGWTTTAPDGSAVWPDDDWAQLRWGAESALQQDLPSRARVFAGLVIQLWPM